MFAVALLALAAALPLASGHASIWHPSMYGFNVTDHTYDYDNRPVAPLTNYTFDKWWFHGHLDHPPNPGDFFELPVGKPATTEIGCNKGATTWFNSSEGGDIRQGDNPCPNSDPSAYHTTGISDVKGCALAIAYESDVTKIQPEDFTVFSINQTCVWTRFTDFSVPARMPPCPPGGCHCAWLWIHSQDSGGEQNYMTGFKCNVTGSTSNVPLAKPQVARRCGADTDNKKPAAPGNCTYGAKQPLYWFQQERNNMFEGTYSPPFYTDLYNFKDGAQDDIFVDSYPNGLPTPSPNSTVVPTPFLGNGIAPAPTSGSDSASSDYSSASSIASTFVSASSSSASAVSSTATTSSSISIASSTAATFSASTLSQSASHSSAAFSSSLSPELPLSTQSASLSSIFASVSATSPTSGTVSESVSVTTSTATVVSTLVITLTANASATTASSSTLGSFSLSSSSIFSPSTAASATPVTSSAPAQSTIFLNGGPSSASAIPTTSAAATASPSQSDSAARAAPTTIDLNFAVRPNSSSETTVRAAARPPVLAATNSNSMCKRQLKRQFKRKVALRRRAAEPSVAPHTESPYTARADEQEPEILSRISIPGLRRHRRLQERSSLWRFF
ncbi:hypothetical protein VTO73DRAFT_8568 [Trametes versicolor]